MISKEFIQKYWTQFLAVFTASLGPISNGMEFGWSSPALPVLEGPSSPVPINHDESFWIESLYMIGGVCGTPVTFLLLQNLGRKYSLIFSESIGFICWILIATATTVEQIYVARFICGLAANCIFVGLPMYTAEVVQPEIRGFLGSFVYTQSLFGILLAYSIVPYIPIWASSTIGATITILMIVTFMWQPESPYFLLCKDKREQAKLELEKLRLAQDVEPELIEICKAVERQNSERSRPIDLLLIGSNRKAVIIMTVLNSAQNLAGMSVITMNVQVILQNSGSSLSSELSAILYGITMCVAAVLGSLMIDRFGRKFLLISSCLISAFFLLLLSAFFFAKDTQQLDTSDWSWVPLFAAIAYALSFKYGMGLVPIIVTAELFPTSVKSMGMVLSDIWFTIMATISIKVYYHTTEVYGTYFPFLLFCCFGVFTAVFVGFYVPETKGKSLEEIQMILKGRKEEPIDGCNIERI